MSVWLRRGTVGLVLAAAGLAIAVPTPARALQTLTLTMVVECNDADGTSSAETAGLLTTNGVYAVAVSPAAGGCPGEARAADCFNGVLVDEQCVLPGTVATIDKARGFTPMTALFVDDSYEDNDGALLVTFTWTVL